MGLFLFSFEVLLTDEVAILFVTGWQRGHLLEFFGRSFLMMVVLIIMLLLGIGISLFNAKHENRLQGAFQLNVFEVWGLIIERKSMYNVLLSRSGRSK